MDRSFEAFAYSPRLYRTPVYLVAATSIFVGVYPLLIRSLCLAYPRNAEDNTCAAKTFVASGPLKHVDPSFVVIEFMLFMVLFLFFRFCFVVLPP